MAHSFFSVVVVVAAVGSRLFAAAKEEEEAAEVPENATKVSIEGIIEEKIERLRDEQQRVGHQRVEVVEYQRDVQLGEDHVADHELERVEHVAD